jgi:hypothetical protein
VRIVAAVLAAAMLLTGCAASDPPTPHSHAAPASPTPGITPITKTITPPPAALAGLRLDRCRARAHAWLHGPAKTEISSMENALSLFNQEAPAHIYAAVTFLHVAALDAQSAGDWPIPHCADPAGHWATFLNDVTAEAVTAGTPPQAAAQGYVPDAAINDSQQVQDALQAASRELRSRIGLNPFG